MIDLSQIAPETQRPIRRGEYDRMVALGLFDEERIELIEGILVAMSPQGSAHAEAVRRMTGLLVLALQGRGSVQIQSPLAISELSEPAPDVAVVPPGDYSDYHPASAFLVVEVADSSLNKDRKVKSQLYAAAGIPEYWVVDIAGDAIEVHTDPAGPKYRAIRRAVRGEAIRLVTFPDVEVDVARILPSRGT